MGFSVLSLPDWSPGAGFKSIGRAWRETLDRMADLPYDFVKSQIVSHRLALAMLIRPSLQDLGTAEPFFTANLLDARRNITPDEEFDLKWSAASLYSGTNLIFGVHLRVLMS